MPTRRASSTASLRARPPATPKPAAPAAHRSAEVVLDLEVERGCVHLVLANCGDAVATQVRVAFSRELLGPDGAVAVSRLPLFQHLGVLRPGRTLRVFWDAAPALFASPARTAPFVATVSWSERARRRQRAEYHHDPSIYRRWPEALASSSL